jgi:hypothetical protein
VSVSTMAMTIGTVRQTIIMLCVSVSVRDSIFDFCKEKEKAFVEENVVLDWRFWRRFRAVGVTMSHGKSIY